MHRSGNKQRMFLSLKQQKNKTERKLQKSVFYLGYFQNILVKMQIFFFMSCQGTYCNTMLSENTVYYRKRVVLVIEALSLKRYTNTSFVSVHKFTKSVWPSDMQF